MATTIAVAGATGDLGGRIVRALRERDAEVLALVRPGSSPEKLAKVEIPGVKVASVELSDTVGLAKALEGVSCVISSIQGLRDVVVEAQTGLLEAAIAAGVPRFIPSDFASDFTKVPAGENRNFEIRRLFQERIDVAPIAATSILNGAFSELLISRMPLLNLKARRVTHWGDADQRLDFTTMDDTAAFAARAALDDSTPRFLRIAGDEISPRELANLAAELTGSEFALVRAGGLEDLAAMIQRNRAGDTSGETKLFPPWQAMQYMHNMFSGRAKLEPLDNDRYPNMRWTTVRDLISAHFGS